MNNIFKINTKAAFAFYIILDILFVGMGMGVPFLCILFGLPVGWYLAKRFKLSERNLNDILNSILKYALFTSIFTFLLMLIIWGPVSTLFLNPTANFVNFGMPLILYDPKISFMGWIILMILISPFLQLLMTIFASYMALWRLFKKKNMLK